MSPNTSSEFFEAKYRAAADPWNFAGSPYELERYAATIAALARRRYHRGFEPGCSVGVLTERLAGLCDEVDAVDFSPSAIAQARERCRGLENVHLACASLPELLPVRGFDLIVLSEIGYYFATEEWTRIAESLTEEMPVGGTLLAVHWLGSSPDHRISGDEVHAVLSVKPRLRLEAAERHAGFRLDRWERV